MKRVAIKDNNNSANKIIGTCASAVNRHRHILQEAPSGRRMHEGALRP